MLVCVRNSKKSVLRRSVCGGVNKAGVDACPMILSAFRCFAEHHVALRFGLPIGLPLGKTTMDHATDLSLARYAPRFKAKGLLAASLSLAMTGGALAQSPALRARDDQFIQGLRDQGMTELFEQYREQVVNDPDLDPVTRHELTITQKEFQAENLLKRARAAQDPAEAQALFDQSRAAFEEMIDAMASRIADHPHDERQPIWETDLAEVLLTDYLMTYYQSATWFYEFGVVSDEQAEAFERAVSLAIELMSDARYRLEILPARMGSNRELRSHLEELGILYKLQSDYKQRFIPYWFGFAAHYVALLPDDHAYFQSLGSNDRVRNQKSTPAAERRRLRDEAELSVTTLLHDNEVADAARLLAGRIVVFSDDLDYIDEGIAKHLDPVVAGSSDNWQGFLASLAKARGRNRAGELDSAIDILSGMSRHPYVRTQQGLGNIFPRVLAADLMHRMLMESVDDATGDEASAQRSAAFEKPYLPLIQDDPRAQYGPYLYRRWSKQVDDTSDPAQFPPIVRMGVGQMLTETGGALAQTLVQLAQTQPLDAIGVPNRHAAELQRRADLRVQAEKDLHRAARFNESLIGEDIEPAIRASGLFGLGFDKYYLAELSKFYDEGDSTFEPYLEVATLWMTLGIEIPNASQAEQAASFSTALHQQFDMLFNNDPEIGVRRQDLREAFKTASASLYANWSNNDTAHGLRLYAGFVFESSGDLATAVDIYRGLPSHWPDYFEARRQMIFAQHRIYEHLKGRAQVLASTAPAEDDADATQAYSEEVAALKDELDQMRRAILDESELLDVDAQDTREDTSLPARRRFSAATAQGAAVIVTAAMEADGADGAGADAALEILDGFENDYSPAGQLASLVGEQADPARAAKTLGQLIQGAQERRILALVDADRLNEVKQVAQAMFEAYPDVAAGVVDDVLVQLENRIEIYEQSEEDAPLPSQKQRAREARMGTAAVAVDLSEQLLAWAKAQGFSDNRVLPYELSLARALLMANEPGQASEIVAPLMEKYPGDFSIAMLGADSLTQRLMAEGNREVSEFNNAIAQYNKIIRYYNAQPALQPIYWEAWIQIVTIRDFLGGEYAEKIPGMIDIQRQRDPNLGGAEFEQKFNAFYRANGG